MPCNPASANGITTNQPTSLTRNSLITR
jgi:hypothetical protein